jgi:hypothetical protein
LLPEGPRLLSIRPWLLREGPWLLDVASRLRRDSPRLLPEGPRLLSVGPGLCLARHGALLRRAGAWRHLSATAAGSTASTLLCVGRHGREAECDQRGGRCKSVFEIHGKTPNVCSAFPLPTADRRAFDLVRRADNLSPARRMPQEPGRFPSLFRVVAARSDRSVRARGHCRRRGRPDGCKQALRPRARVGAPRPEQRPFRMADATSRGLAPSAKRARRRYVTTTN